MRSMKSQSQNHFAEVPKADIQRSSFDRSHGVKTTFDSGLLIPFFVDEALPGDTFNLRTAGFARLATPIYPVMDNMHLETFYFSVPLRLVWDNFKKMMGEQQNPNDSIDFLVPSMTSPAGDGYDESSIHDYFGIPTKVPGLEHSALFHRAYNLIYNEWFRDQNLQDSVPVPTDDGPDDPADYATLRRGKRHDYFTSSLPWPQKGPAVDIPLGNSAPIMGMGVASSAIAPFEPEPKTVFNNDGSGNLVQYADTAVASGGSGNPSVFYETSSDALDPANPHIYADLSSASAATINQLRQSFQIQKMYERDARGGTRYTELIRSHFKVTSPDARQQRPEFCGGGYSRVNITPLAATANTATEVQNGSHLGTLSAVGTASFQGHGFTKSFTEHSIVMGFVNVRADITYQQGLNKMFSRQDKLDFFWPALAQIGEQAVLNKEIYAQGNDSDEDVFGYQERFAEYRYKPSTIHGQFRSSSDVPLDSWHLAQNFEDLPTLSSEFIEDNPPLDRVIAVQDEPQFIGDFYHKLITARPMPLFGVPGNIDRF